jgi:hypothetical protein
MASLYFPCFPASLLFQAYSKLLGLPKIYSEAKYSASYDSPSDEESLSLKQCLLTICNGDEVDQHIMDQNKIWMMLMLFQELSSSSLNMMTNTFFTNFPALPCLSSHF